MPVLMKRTIWVGPELWERVKAIGWSERKSAGEVVREAMQSWVAGSEALLPPRPTSNQPTKARVAPAVIPPLPSRPDVPKVDVGAAVRGAGASKAEKPVSKADADRALREANYRARGGT